MSTLKEWIEEMAGGEPVEAVVIGEMGWGSYGADKVRGYNDQPRNTVIPWDEAVPFISYEFINGFGAPGCNAVVAWTRSWVIFVSQYDGSTEPERIPRNPTDHEPGMPGG